MDVLYKAELRNVKFVYNFLKSISFKDLAYVRITTEGLKITVEEMRSVQTSAYIPCDIFDTYKIYCDSDIHFKISMKILTEFLNIFGDDGNPSLKIVYRQHGEPLMLIIGHDEENFTADCKLVTLEEEAETLDLYLSTDNRVNNVVVKAPLFVNIIRDLDVSSDKLILILSPDAPYFRLITNGMLGEIQVDISPNSEMVEIFRCKKKEELTYTLVHIKQLEKVMNLSSRISISTGEDAGLLNLQMIIEPHLNSTNSTTNLHRMFAEYYCTALIEDDD